VRRKRRNRTVTAQVPAFSLCRKGRSELGFFAAALDSFSSCEVHSLDRDTARSRGGSAVLTLGAKAGEPP